MFFDIVVVVLLSGLFVMIAGLPGSRNDPQRLFAHALGNFHDAQVGLVGACGDERVDKLFHHVDSRIGNLALHLASLMASGWPG